MAVFFISDTHFGHANIIRTCKRPFDGVAEMDDAIVSRWNACVGPSDTVYHLGDFCYRNSRAADAYVRELNGEIHLIAGNHDEETIARHPSLFASIGHIREIHERGRRIVMCRLSHARMARLLGWRLASVRPCAWQAEPRTAWLQPRCRRGCARLSPVEHGRNRANVRGSRQPVLRQEAPCARWLRAGRGRLLPSIQFLPIRCDSAPTAASCFRIH